MFFWIICSLLALIVGAIVAAPLWRAGADPAPSPDVAFYRSQLGELDRDVARGVIEPEEAARSRVEVARRLLAADGAVQNTAPDRPSPKVAFAVIAFSAVAGLGTYIYLGAPGYADLPLKARLAASDQVRADRPSQAAMVAAAPLPAPVDVPAEYLESVTTLRQIMPTRPDDLQGWALLATHEAQLRNFEAAAAAQVRVTVLKGETVTADDQRLLLDLLVAAADGLVSQQAEDVARAILADDPDDITARYYIGALYNQTDRPDVTLRMWREVVATGDATRFHVTAARAQIEDAAFRAGVKYTLPAAVGPSAEDIANAQDLSPEDRDVMIRSMVAGLSDRLASEGGPAADWARLIRAFGVLGEVQAATEIWLEAAQVFASSDTAMTTLREAATAAGVTP